MASASSETDYVTLISNDGFSFVVQRSAATISPMVRKMLDPQSMCFFLPPSPYLPTKDKGDSANFKPLPRHSCPSLPLACPAPLTIPLLLLSSPFLLLISTVYPSNARAYQQRFVRKSGIVLEKVCEYFYYNERNKDARDVPDMDFPTELCLEILMAADYLDV
ncbi:hypothetical protein D0867_16150 [Hortaea werneckii]|uniref:Elongin-C n=1 Tax=Hortaea werneckii TaxID=91943 RepID=A0A3M6YAH2_HORWE|nr:hypothetical protein D0867_16150 [Hortaea werneckii]RMX99806.1 hypothetical protein D0866_16006 [Hortaea werneckii]